MHSLTDYNRVFEEERRRNYPHIDTYERECAYAIDRVKLESMARTLACPIKVNPPNWQHGRVIYSTLRKLLAARRFERDAILLDIGTAKGFSACVMSHAVADANSFDGSIVSIDVVSPESRVARNSAAELDGLKTIDEFTVDHRAKYVSLSFYGRGSTLWLQFAIESGLHVPFAFVDGKHTYAQVRLESVSLSQLQQPGDIIVFDDCQIEPVGRAVVDFEHSHGYSIRYIDIWRRIYAVAVKQ